MEVGVRELRDHLSRYLAEVQTGTEVVVTDHGRAIARLVGLDRGRTIDRLVADGIVTPPRTAGRTRLKRPVRVSAPVSELVREQRR